MIVLGTSTCEIVAVYFLNRVAVTLSGACNSALNLTSSRESPTLTAESAKKKSRFFLTNKVYLYQIIIVNIPFSQTKDIFVNFSDIEQKSLATMHVGNRLKALK